jgi:hypothetical protein
MRSIAVTAICAAFLSSAATAQAVVLGEVVLKDGGRPLEFTTVGVLTQGRQLLTSEKGRFQLPNLPQGELRLRFKRIGFAPHDTTLVLTAGDTARIRIEMARLVIQLPEMLVSGRCENETPREPVPGFLSQLIDQIVQNSERMRLLAAQRPFQVRMAEEEGFADAKGVFTTNRVDTVLKSPLPERTYKPREVVFRLTTGPNKGAWGIMLPELADIADTAFTNNHCFRYAGRARVRGDSVILVEFVPVPWLDKELDLNGTLYLSVDGYQMLGSFTRLNHIRPDWKRNGLEEYYVDAAFKEVVPGVPVLDWMELVNRRRINPPRFIKRSHAIEIEWKDSTVAGVDTVRSRR